MKKKVVLADRDEYYIRHLSSLILRERPRLFEVAIFTEEPQLYQYLCGHETGCLFVSEELLSPRVRVSAGNRLVVLSDVEEDGESVCKFQSEAQMLGQMKQYLPLTELPECRLLCVEGKGESESAFALSAALLFAEKREGDVLYLDWDPFSPLRELFAEERNETLSDWLYEVQNGRSVLNVQPLFWHGIQIVFGPNCPEDAGALQGEDPVKLLLHFLQESRFEHVICRLAMSPLVTAGLLDVCDRLYLREQSGWEQKRQEAYVGFLREQYGTDADARLGWFSFSERTGSGLLTGSFPETYRKGWRDQTWNVLHRDAIL